MWAIHTRAHSQTLSANKWVEKTKSSKYAWWFNRTVFVALFLAPSISLPLPRSLRSMPKTIDFANCHHIITIQQRRQRERTQKSNKKRRESQHKTIHSVCNNSELKANHCFATLFLCLLSIITVPCAIDAGHFFLLLFFFCPFSVVNHSETATNLLFAKLH